MHEYRIILATDKRSESIVAAVTEIKANRRPSAAQKCEAQTSDP